MLTTIVIKDLSIETSIGICDWEYERDQTLYLTLEINYDAEKASTSDAIENALDYADVSEKSIAFIKNHKARLLEPVLHELLSYLLDQFSKIISVSATIKKPEAIAEAKYVAQTATLTRAKQ